jgi:acyl-CoA reductase-like NAD-dependent aldehyde dehydrogenase
VITGGGHEIGDILVSDERISMVSFTGSTEVGKSVQKVAGLKKLHLELGGKGMAIVLDDADPVFAAGKCVEGALKSAGQRCDAISAVLVQEKIANTFVEQVLRKFDSSWKGGDPSSDDNQINIGPLINESAASRVQDLVNDAVSRGAVLLRGGKHKDTYFEPTVLDHVPQDSRIALEETFGPVVTIIRIEDQQEAIELGKKSRYGLDSCVFTSDFYRMWKISKRLVVGEITVNDLPRHGVGFFPFGGSKESGMGREGIGYSIDEMTVLKTIIFNLEPAKLGKTMHSK